MYTFSLWLLRIIFLYIPRLILKTNAPWYIPAIDPRIYIYYEGPCKEISTIIANAIKPYILYVIIITILIKGKINLKFLCLIYILQGYSFFLPIVFLYYTIIDLVPHMILVLLMLIYHLIDFIKD